VNRKTARLAGMLGILGTSACAGMAPAGPVGSTFAPGRGGEMPRRVGNAMIMEGAQLYERSGNVLSILRSRIGNMQVRSTDGCPAIVLRGQKTVVTSSNPLVYVNGQRTSDTCILESMQAADVARVEVYPMGVTSRPGYLAHPHGLILVFLRGAE